MYKYKKEHAIIQYAGDGCFLRVFPNIKENHQVEFSYLNLLLRMSRNIYNNKILKSMCVQKLRIKVNVI